MSGSPASGWKTPLEVRGLEVGRAFLLNNRTVIRVSKLDENTVYYRVYDPGAALPSMAHQVRRSVFDDMIADGKAIRVGDYDVVG